MFSSLTNVGGSAGSTTKQNERKNTSEYSTVQTVHSQNQMHRIDALQVYKYSTANQSGKNKGECMTQNLPLAFHTKDLGQGDHQKQPTFDCSSLVAPLKPHTWSESMFSMGSQVSQRLSMVFA
jgi:hypothetical protein